MVSSADDYPSSRPLMSALPPELHSSSFYVVVRASFAWSLMPSLCHQICPLSQSTHEVFLFILFFFLLYSAVMLSIFFPFPPSSFSSFTTQCFHRLVQEVSLSAPCKADCGVLSLASRKPWQTHCEHLGPISASRQSVSFLSYSLLQAEYLAWGLAKSQLGTT